MEQAGGSESKRPVFSHEFIDLFADNVILGGHASLFGPNMASATTSKDWVSQRFSSKDVDETFKTLQQKDSLFKEKIPPPTGAMVFATTFLGRDSNIRIEHFLKNVEQNRISLSEILKRISQLAKDRSIELGRTRDPDLAANVASAVGSAILLGYSAPVDIFDNLLHKMRWGFAVFPNLLMPGNFRESRKKLLDIVTEAARQYAEYTEHPNFADFYNPGPAEIMEGGGASTTIQLLNWTKDFQGGAQALGEYAKLHVLLLKHNQIEDPLGLNYAALSGFLVAKARYEDATRLYQTMANSS